MRETIPLGGHHIFDKVVARRLLRFYRRIALRRPEARAILDIGCGPGHLAAALAHSHPEADVLGLDLDPAQVRMALRHEAPNLNFDEGDAKDLPLLDGSRDWVLATETFHHWADPDKGIAEAHRVLAPGGQFWIIEGAGDMTRDEIQAWTGRRPWRILAWWIRQVFTRHGYLPDALERDVIAPLERSAFRHVSCKREDGWWVVVATK